MERKMELLVISLLAALAIVQGVKLYVKDKVLDEYREAGNMVLEALADIADGKMKVIRLDEKNVRVVPNASYHKGKT
jgi:hypothetical protein